MTIYVIHTNPDGSTIARSYEGISEETVELLSLDYKTSFQIVDKAAYDAAIAAQSRTP